MKERYDDVQVELIPAGGGKFEVEVDGNLIYSKKRTGRHCDEREIIRAIEAL